MDKDKHNEHLPFDIFKKFCPQGKRVNIIKGAKRNQICTTENKNFFLFNEINYVQSYLNKLTIFPKN